MKTAFSIMQTMTIFPFQNIILDAISKAFVEGGIGKKDLYFDQLTPLVILSETADETDSTIQEVEDEVNESMENSETTEMVDEREPMRPSDYGFSKYYETEIVKD